jgi:DNA-binding CsgD family transcriptional regulator
MSAYGLTQREQQLTRLVLPGSSTIGIADRLVISVHTVQSHVRNVFTKTGVRARRDLLTKISLPTSSHASETMSSARLRIGRCAASRLVSPARTADPTGTG